jgi:hypothetical protein
MLSALLCSLGTAKADGRVALVHIACIEEAKSLLVETRFVSADYWMNAEGKDEAFKQQGFYHLAALNDKPVDCLVGERKFTVSIDDFKGQSLKGKCAHNEAGMIVVRSDDQISSEYRAIASDRCQHKSSAIEINERWAKVCRYAPVESAAVPYTQSEQCEFDHYEINSKAEF